MKRDSRIFVAGHRGLVGSAVVRQLQTAGHENIVTRTRAELDLTQQTDVRAFFEEEKPEFVVLAAAKVGGILANSTYPADFIAQNLAIQSNVIEAAHKTGVKRLLFLGSSCIYPRECPQPMKEEYLLTGPLEPTNQAYAIAKISGIAMCQAYNQQFKTRYLAVMPTNLYGPNDNYDLETSHVIPALLRKFHEGKEAASPSVTVWGTGQPRREFLHVDDLAAACVFLLSLSEDSFRTQLTQTLMPLINVGFGDDLTIKELAQLIAEETGYRGEIRFDTSKPDGTPRKLLDTARLTALGWKPRIPLRKGIGETYRDFLKKRTP